MPNYLVVIDTNVLVSALLSKHSDTATVRLIELLFSPKITILYNDEIIEEYEDVLNREKFGFPKERIQTIINMIYNKGIYVERLDTKEKFLDKTDLVFYEVCMAKREEDSMLVTGNMKHFPNKPFIVTPSEFLSIVNK